MKITDCQPGSGNPTVRDARGAYGNVSYGGTRNPLHTPPGCRTETLCLRLRAPYVYPTTRAWVHGGSLGTWESRWSPCGAEGKRSADRGGKSLPAWRGSSSLSHAPSRPRRDPKKDECCQVSGEEREHRTTPRGALGSLRGAEDRGRWGSAAHGTPGRERSETRCCPGRWKSCRRHAPCGAVVISGRPGGALRAGSPDGQ